jgi:cytochrome oxidase Cu insertion factor (SCO1/SenC/PrrC family)
MDALLLAVLTSVPWFAAAPAEKAKEKVQIAIGKPAPEIEGRDTNGKAFKLSDYRGKVVVLDFWGNW